MEGEAQAQDVNQESPAESSAAESQESEETSAPAEANSASPETKPEAKSEAKKENDNKIPQDRFNEVIGERNELRKRLENLESRFTKQEDANRPNPVDLAVQKLMKRGIDEESARILVETQLEVTNSVVNDRVAPIEKHSVEAEIGAWTKEFANSHKDYAELEPLMYSVFQSLPEQTQTLVVSSKEGLELLYSHAKRQKLESDLDKRYQQGVNDGYKNKASKSSVSSEPMSGQKPGLPSLEDIGNMSLEDYKKVRNTVLKNQNKYSQK